MSKLVRTEGREISRASLQLLLSLMRSNCPPLQVFCELPLVQAVLQRLQAHRGGRGAGEERAATKTRSPGHDCHQHAGGEPGQLRQSGLSAEAAGQGPRTTTQGGPCVL